MIYFKYLALNLKSVLQYRLSTWLIALGQALTTVFSFLALALLFRRFGNLAGWSFAEAALCYGVTGMAFSLAESFARGFDAFSRMVIQGEFDRVLLRPRNTIIQVLGAKTDITRIGRVIVSFAILCMVLPRTGIVWDFSKIFTLIMMILGGAFTFSGIFILGATVCFFTLDGLEVINIFTDGGRELASYPLPVYGKWIARFFTFIIPYGCMNYLPLLYLTGRAERWPLLYMLMPLFGFVFILPCVLVWRFGIRHYKSAGS
ncbi:MAG: ABC-2 family transporter protein [Treponema sp.]|nr:ABC-2 family transporter protein [Treponema sp.]